MTVLFQLKSNPNVTIARGTSRLGDDVFMAYKKGQRGRITPVLSSVGDVLRYVSDIERTEKQKLKKRKASRSR